MAYKVQGLSDLYSDLEAQGSSLSYADMVGRFLSEQEGEGFTLSAVIPGHETWLKEFSANGNVSAMLVLHKPEPEPEAIARIIN